MLPALPTEFSVFQFRKRLARVKQLLRAREHPAALLLSAAPEAVPDVSRLSDTETYFQIERDFYYLTGLTLPAADQSPALLISSRFSKPLLLVTPRDKAREAWYGIPANFSAIAKLLGAELREYNGTTGAVKALLENTEELFYQNTAGTLGYSVAKELIELPWFARAKLPRRLSHCHEILRPLRLRKDAEEVSVLKKANLVTAKALGAARALLKPGISKSALLAKFKSVVSELQADLAFPPIVAPGASAAVLHATPHDCKVKPDEFVLFDVGARVFGYSGDISRCYPASDHPHPAVLEIYHIVRSAHALGLRSVHAGVPVQSLYQRVARELTIGLVALGVLRGKISTLMAKKAFRTYFPHSLGHTLGLDVHDVGNLRAHYDSTLEEGYVFTIEPGLYFPKKVGKVPACGIRIEDNILVTKKGCENLSLLAENPEFAKT